MPRKLIVNADDFGFARDVSEGILHCHKNGILTATTLMATGSAFRHAVDLAKATPTLDVGCHLVLVQGPGLPASVPALLQALALRQIDPHAVFASQITTILKAGLRPSHLDTHKHTHLLPGVLNAVLRVSEEFTIPWIRKPADFALDPAAPIGKQRWTRAMRWATRNFDRKLAAAGARRTDHFTGFQLTGRLNTGTLAAALGTLPEGTTELMCHPGFLGATLATAGTRLKESRQQELDALLSDDVRAVLKQKDIQLTRYSDL